LATNLGLGRSERLLWGGFFRDGNFRSWPAAARRPVLAAKPKPGGFPAQHRLLLNGKEYWYGFAEKTDVCRIGLRRLLSHDCCFGLKPKLKLAA
jgi:hypothetical protein